ncbi:pheromone precursor [Trametes coccinea BRFM310]|uniref:Pheromone n=1 Tax=Trametes coccinea (strain BRFM310) TaxID=1353009 RepID=A0A1Y2IS19_TRAC3|nr:pheromone precursor [Trametes coccinea BRFM310]
MDAFSSITDFLESEAARTADAPASPSTESGVPVNFEYVNNNYSHSWCTIA